MSRLVSVSINHTKLLNSGLPVKVAFDPFFTPRPKALISAAVLEPPSGVPLCPRVPVLPKEIKYPRSTIV